jgi:CubicO group peptidase (beta-lactamase class C family)
MYDIASVTKAIPTSCALLTLVDQDKVSLEDKIVDYISEFGNFPDKKDVTVKHLLTYTLDLIVPAMASLKDKSADEIIDIIVKAPLRNKPGSKFLYTNSTALFIGMLVEKISGKKLDIFARENFFKSLNMNKTTFHPEEYNVQEIAPTEVDNWRGLVHGQVQDESTYVLQRAGYYYGISGLFSTVPDLLKFLEMLLNYGKLDNKRYFSENIVKKMNENQISNIGESVGLGWELNDKRRLNKDITGNISSKSGFTGCIVYYDLNKEIAVTILSNRTYPKRPNNIDAINEVRRDIMDIVFSNLKT